MHELIRLSHRLRQKGLTVLSARVDRLAIELSNDPIENVLSAYRRIHDIKQPRKLVGSQTVCTYWEGDNELYCDHSAYLVDNDGNPVCYKHFRALTGEEPTTHNTLACLRTTAAIRKNNLPKEQRCPFGLSIPQSCLHVGEVILLMEPNEHDFKRNRKIYNKMRGDSQCPYAAKIIKKKQAVDCNFGTSTEGLETPKLYHSSPIYPRLWEGFNTVNLDRNYHQYRDFNYVSVYG